MIWLALCLSLYALIGDAHARGAGRAFPIEAENYAIDKLQDINPNIEWDHTNYLIDRSGHYANCDRIERTTENIGDVTREGARIVAVFDYIEGAGVDAGSVDDYIVQVMDRWARSREHGKTIRSSDKFGCSVRPGCSLGRRRNPVTTIVCLFSTAPREYRPIPQDQPETPQRGLAFTPEEYDIAESITGKKWDRSHYLENLSGFETSCNMVVIEDWPFTTAKAMADERGMKVTGMKGTATNYGNTETAIERILRGFKNIQYASHVGCSVIPDCVDDRGDLGGDPVAVVACIYEEAYIF